METNKITKTELKEFHLYCFEFYGANGLYSHQLKGGVSSNILRKAIQIYLLSINEMRSWGGGDSLDRERVREILEVLI